MITPMGISNRADSCAAIRSGRPLPDWYMRDIVQEMLLGEIAAGKPVFHN